MTNEVSTNKQTHKQLWATSPAGYDSHFVCHLYYNTGSPSVCYLRNLSDFRQYVGRFSLCVCLWVCLWVCLFVDTSFVMHLLLEFSSNQLHTSRIGI